MTHPPSQGPADSPRRRRNPQATRDRLVRAALHLFTTQGYHETTTPEIARRAGVAEGTIYRHFQSKEHLLNELYRAGVRLFQRAVLETGAGASCRDRLRAIADAWRGAATRDPALVLMVFGGRFTGLLDDRSRSAAEGLREVLGSVIASGKAAGEVRPGSAATWAEVWYRLVTLMLERIATAAWKPDDAAVGLVVDAAWNAIATPPAGQEHGRE